MIDKNSLNKLIGQYQGRIYRLAFSISRNEKDAEDILQNTLIKIMRKLSTFKSRSGISTWIYRIAYNESLMYLRKRRRLFNSSNAYKEYNKRLPQAFTVNWSRLPDQALLDKELRERIDSALKDVPLAYRMPILLHRIEGLSLTEASRVLKVRESTLKTRLHRAYLMVKEKLSAYDKDEPGSRTSYDKSCGIWTGFLFDFASAKLPLARKSSFNRHIKDCPSCNSFLDSYLKAIRLTGFLDCRDIPAELKQRIVSFLALKK